jgi:hypothetical protein
MFKSFANSLVRAFYLSLGFRVPGEVVLTDSGKSKKTTGNARVRNVQKGTAKAGVMVRLSGGSYDAVLDAVARGVAIIRQRIENGKAKGALPEGAVETARKEFDAFFAAQSPSDQKAFRDSVETILIYAKTGGKKGGKRLSVLIQKGLTISLPAISPKAEKDLQDAFAALLQNLSKLYPAATIEKQNIVEYLAPKKLRKVS